MWEQLTNGAQTFVSEVLEAVHDGLSQPDSNRVHLLYLGSQTLIHVQDLILSEKSVCFFSSPPTHLPLL